MNTNHAILLLLAASPSGAQQPFSAPQAPTPAAASTLADAASWRIPLHADRDEAGTYWASGPSYKVRLDQGMTFYPVLGAEAPENLPLRWQTESVAFEGMETLVGEGTAATARVSEWRYELVRPGVTEVYDVVTAGVEQSFVVADPRRGGPARDLVVRGRIATPLAAAPRDGAHGALSFTDGEGRAVLEYGAAFALDASGRRLPITTSLRDGVVELRVPATWLWDAAWPVTVDPLTQRTTLVSSVSGPSGYPVIAHDPYSDRHAVADARPVSASDYDLRLYLRQGSWAHVATVFSDVTTASTRYPTVTYAQALQARWLLAFERRTPTTSRVRLYFHDRDDLVMNNGVGAEIFAPAPLQDTEPSLGTANGHVAYLAMKRDAAATPIDTEASIPVGVLIDVNARTYSPPVLLHTNPGNNYDVDAISVSRYGGTMWLVVWQEYNFDNPGDDWDVIGQTVGSAGQIGNYVVVGAGSASGTHKLTPYVDGYGLDWAVCFLTRANTGSKSVGTQGSQLRVQRLGIHDGGLQVEGSSRLVEWAVGNDLVLGRTNHPFEMSVGTESHWALTWRRANTGALVAARIGADAVIAELTVLEAPPATGTLLPASVCWDQNAFAFAVVYATDGVSSLDPIYGRHFQFDPRAQNSAYGTGCSGTVTATTNAGSSKPFPGTKQFRIELSNARPSVPTVLAAAAAPADLPLGGGCRLLLDPPTFVLVYQSVSGANGKATFYTAIPSSVQGSIYWQFAQLDKGALTTSNGLLTQVY